MSIVSWRKLALNGIFAALGRPSERLDLSEIPIEELRRTKLEPFLAKSAGADAEFAGGYFRDAWQLQRQAFVQTLHALTDAGITVTTFKGCELNERYSDGDSFGLMADADVIVALDHLVDTMSLLYRHGLKPGVIDYASGRLMPLGIQDIGAIESQHFQLPPFLALHEVELSPDSFAFAKVYGRRPLKVFGDRCYLIFEIDVHHRTTIDIAFDVFEPHCIESVFSGARTLSPTDHLWSIASRYYNEVSLHNKTSLRELVYMALLLRHERIDWKRFLSFTEEFGTYAACYYPLAFLRALVPSCMPADALDALRPVEGRRGRDYGWQLGKLFNFVESVPFDPERMEFRMQ